MTTDCAVADWRNIVHKAATISKYHYFGERKENDPPVRSRNRPPAPTACLEMRDESSRQIRAHDPGTGGIVEL